MDSHPHLCQKPHFCRVFNNKLPVEKLAPDTHLYRARIISSNDINKLGVNLSDIANELYSVLMTPEDFEALRQMKVKSSLILSPEDYFQIKQLGLKEYTSEQLEHFESVRKKYSAQGVYGFNAAESGVPPEPFRKEGRLNTTSDAYLYLALEKETVIHEMRPSIGQQYSLATFQTTTELNIVNLTGENLTPEEAITAFGKLPFQKISEPNIENDKRFYRITQYMAHILQKRGFDGIKYKSAMQAGGNNILLFENTKVKFLSSEIVIINNVNIDYSCVLPFSE